MCSIGGMTLGKILILFLFILLPAMSIGQEAIRLSVQTGHSSTVSELEFSDDGSILASSGLDNKVILWDVLKGKQILTLTGHESPVLDLDFHPESRLLASVDASGKAIIWNIMEGEAVEEIQLPGDQGASLFFPVNENKVLIGGNGLFSFDFDQGELLTLISGQLIQSIEQTNDGTLLAITGKNDISLYNYPSMSPGRRFHGKFKRVKFDKNGEYLYAAGTNGVQKKWPINKLGLIKRQSITANRLWHTFYDVDVNDQLLVTANRDNLIYVRKLESGKLIHVLQGHKQDVRALAIDPNGKILASAGYDKLIRLWDLSTGKLINSLVGIGERVQDVVFGEQGKSIVVGYGNGTIKRIYLDQDAMTMTKEMTMGFFKKMFGWEYSIRRIDNYNDAEQLARVVIEMNKRNKGDKAGFKKRKSTFAAWNIEENEIYPGKWTMVKIAEEKLNLSNFESDMDVDWSGEKLNIDLGQEGRMAIEPEHGDGLTAVSRNPALPILVTAGYDGLIKFWNTENSNHELSFVALMNQDYIFVTPENYYYATKGALSGVGFFVEGKILSFNQFDTQFNRPDLVFDKLPNIDKEIVNHYYLAYKKRLKKLGVKEIEGTNTLDIPGFKILNEDLNLVTRERNLRLDLVAKSTDSPLNRLYVLIDGVPIYGKEGKEISGEQFEKTIDLRLNPGLNNLQLYVTNEKGIASYHENLMINCQAKELKPDLYLVTIGASEFQQSEYNLNYASKDAQDIANYFRESKSFENVHVKSFINSEVTLENLKTIDDFLSPARTEDAVIVTVAGHGLMDSNLDYYIATYDMDFSDPAGKGLAYVDLEDYLDRTASRKKTLLLDACHSGELDKEEVELSIKEQTEFGEVSFRNVGPSVEYKGDMSLKSSFELSKMLFADMRANNGATIISSAGGAEYAIEGNDWNNGVFTFTFLNGLKTMKADLNGDGKIMLSEIQRYLLKKVPEITNGKQTPTSRIENLNNDFLIK